MYFAGTDSPEALAEQLIASEDTKYRMFNFVKILNQDLEILENQITDLKVEVKEAEASLSAQQKSNKDELAVSHMN